MTREETELLITKYIKGETSHDEERRMALELMRDNLPKEWKIIATMIGELTRDEALFDHIKENKS